MNNKEQVESNDAVSTEVDLTPIERMVTYTVYGKYCAKDFRAGEYCRFIRFKKFGSTPVCTLFYEEELYRNPEQGYKIERCQACLEEEDAHIQAWLAAMRAEEED